MITQFFGHAFTANHRVHLVVLPLDARLISLIEEVLDEGRVSQNQVAITWAEKAQGREDLPDVRPGRLDDAVAIQGQRHVEAGCPSAHGEGVDGDQVRVAETVAGKEADVAMGDVSLGFRADPVVGRSRRTARLVDRGAAKRDLPVEASLFQWISVDITFLVGLRELL